MKKIKLHAIGNEKNYNYYIFDKTTEAAKALSKILKKTLGLSLNLYTSKEDKNNIPIHRKINFEKRKEGHEVISGQTKKARADIFYGNKKMFIALHCSLSLRKKFNEALEKISHMPKLKQKQRGNSK